MTTIRKLFIVIPLLAAGTAEAVQLGQLTVASRRGEPLAARIEIYGATAESARAFRFELRPDIGTDYGGVVADFSAATAFDAAGNPYVSLRSDNPVTTAPLAFRLRLLGHDGSVVQHYSLALSEQTQRDRKSVV